MRNRPILTVILSVFTAASLGGCAGYKLTPLANDEHNPREEGYVFYAPAHFLLGTLKSVGDPAKGVRPEYEFKIVSLPDPQRPYRFTRYEFLAKSDLKINFEDGWKFTGAESSTDSTAALSALVDLAKAGIAAAAPDAPPLTPPPVLMFRIKFDAGSFRLVPVQVG